MNMKRFMEMVIVIKNFASMCFAGIIMLYAVVGGWFFGLDTLQFSLIWQFLFIALAYGVLQFVFFSGEAVKKMRYSLRYLLFMVAMYGVLSAVALLFAWFPPSVAGWLAFSGLYLALFAILGGVFEAYFHLTGKRYAQFLNAYKSAQSK